MDPITSTARDLAVYGTSSTLEHRTVSIPERSNRVCLHPSCPKGGPRVRILFPPSGESDEICVCFCVEDSCRWYFREHVECADSNGASSDSLLRCLARDQSILIPIGGGVTTREIGLAMRRWRGRLSRHSPEPADPVS